jgi:serine/alanine adding enzyme
MPVNIKIANSLDEKVWGAFVDQHPCSNIFHTPEMFQVYNHAKGYHPQLWAAIDETGKIHALLTPVQVTLMNGFLRRLTTRSVAYGSVLCSGDIESKKALQTLLNVYSENCGRVSLFTEMRNLYDLSFLQIVLCQSGFVYENHLNYLIDINGSPQQVLQSIGARTRKHIRHALRKGTVTVDEFCDLDLLPVWYELVRKSYNACHVPLADISLFEAAFSILHSRGMVQFWLAQIDSTYVAASAELVYKDVIYGWYSGVDRAYIKEIPGELLMWHVLERGAISGYKTYDFGGAGRPDEDCGVRDFKAKFGGQLVCYGRNTKVHSPKLLRLCEKCYQIYRQFIGRL